MKTCDLTKPAMKVNGVAPVNSTVRYSLPFHARLSLLILCPSGSHGHKDLPENVSVPERTETIAGPFQRECLMNERLDLSNGRPLQDCLHVSPGASIAPDQALLFNEEWPKVHRYLPACSRTTGQDCSSARQAVEYLFEDGFAPVRSPGPHPACRSFSEPLSATMHQSNQPHCSLSGTRQTRASPGPTLGCLVTLSFTRQSSTSGCG